ncbi:MAG: bile acid:sodium symporter family protein, partial [Leptospira sp.]|nr:bile acid:sodium symporter family protein [Leptospira sp.]
MILITRLFPVWVLLFSAISLFFPATFSWFNGAAITISLGIIMLGMGITLTIGDFERIFRFPKFVLIGVLLQYTVMPASGWVISYMMNLPAPLALGLILVSACPGGTASNVITYLAKGDVALSVTMTSVSTILSVILTPFLTFLLAGNKIEVNPYSLMLSTFEVVILPVAVGVVMNRYLKNFTAKIIPASPLVAVILITLIVSSVIGSSKNEILESGVNLLISVFLLHSSGFFFGYIISRI